MEQATSNIVASSCRWRRGIAVHFVEPVAWATFPEHPLVVVEDVGRAATLLREELFVVPRRTPLDEHGRLTGVGTTLRVRRPVDGDVPILKEIGAAYTAHEPLAEDLFGHPRGDRVGADAGQDLIPNVTHLEWVKDGEHFTRGGLGRVALDPRSGGADDTGDKGGAGARKRGRSAVKP